MIPAFVTRAIILSVGFLYPAFNSFKAIRDKNTREYVKWMMYWIVFACFCVLETFADVFVAFWCPFYQELKILTVIWFLAPATRGSSYLYRHFVHPFLAERAAEIDGHLGRIHRQGIVLIVSLTSRLFNSITTFLLEAAAKALPQLAFGAALLHEEYNQLQRRGAPVRSVLTASSSSQIRPRPNQLPLETEGHGDEGDSTGFEQAANAGRFQLNPISEFSDADEVDSAPSVTEPRNRRQPQLRKQRGTSRVKVEEGVVMASDPLISEDDSDSDRRSREEPTRDDILLQDEDVVELARSESMRAFEREFLPREMLPSPSDEDATGVVAAKKRSAATRAAPVKAATSKSNSNVVPGVKSRRLAGERSKQSRR